MDIVRVRQRIGYESSFSYDELSLSQDNKTRKELISNTFPQDYTFQKLLEKL